MKVAVFAVALWGILEVFVNVLVQAGDQASLDTIGILHPKALPGMQGHPGKKLF